MGEERKARDKELSERRSAVHAREEMNTRMEEREKARRDIVLEAQGDLGEKAEQALKQNVVTNALHHTLNVNVVEGEQQVMSAYEAAFRKIKESTGVSDVNEVIRKEVPHAGGDPREPRQDDLDATSRIENLAEERQKRRRRSTRCASPAARRRGRGRRWTSGSGSSATREPTSSG